MAISCSPLPKEDKTTEGTKLKKTNTTDNVLFKGKIVMDSTFPNINIEINKNVSKEFENTYYYALKYLYEKGDYERAIQVFKMLIEKYPMNSYTDNCQFYIGVSYYKLGYYDKALIELNKVSMYFPDKIKSRDTQKWIIKVKNKLKG